MPGTKYRLGERIGAGGMAEVFRAHTIGTQGFERLVAIKRVLPHWSANPRFADMFINEARTMATLHHVNVVAVSDFARDGEGRLFLVMELVEGVALSRLTRSGPVPLPVAVYIVSEMLRGLGHMHDCLDAAGNPLGLVHRDLSTNNVLLSWDGAVKISDFGLAKAYAGNSAGDSDAYGTPGYMSPEQIRGGTIDRRSDLFAVGVILYELLTGTAPFVGANRIHLMAVILRQHIEPPSSLRSEIPADLEAITMQLLERDPDRRPESAQAAIEALERCSAASHLGRTQLGALLHERFASHGSQGPSGSEAPRVTEIEPAEPDALPAVWLVGPAEEAPNASQAPTVQAPAPLALPSPDEQGPAPAEQACAPAPLQGREPQNPRRSALPPSGRTPNGKRRALVVALVLLVGSVAGSKLLPRSSDPTGQVEAIKAVPQIESANPSMVAGSTTAVQASASPTPEVATKPPATTPLVERRAPTARATRGFVIDTSRAGDSSPLDYFVKGTR